jgi:two-component system, OmpR family, sensor histidine kinase KdpD
MPQFRIAARAWPLLCDLCLTLLLVAFTTLFVFLLVEQGVTHGSVIYLVPVVIAAIRWGLLPALFAAAFGTFAAAFFFFPPVYSFEVSDPQEVVNLLLYVFCAILVSQLASRLKRQLEVSRQREIDIADLYAFSRRLAVAFDVSDIHAAVERVLLFTPGRERSRRSASSAPDAILHHVDNLSAGAHAPEPHATITDQRGGSIRAQSEGPRRGTLMTIGLPVAQTVAPQLESDTDE